MTGALVFFSGYPVAQYNLS